MSQTAGSTDGLPRLLVDVDISLCVGHGACLARAPQIFTRDAYGQSTLRESFDGEIIAPSEAVERAVLQAATDCPVSAIRVALWRADGVLVPRFPPPEEHDARE